jgi:hypothetical protein
VPWREACAAGWSGATYSNPPVVAGFPCMFYPTPQGTLYWTFVPGEASGLGYPAAAVERDDGFFDWVYLIPYTNRLVFQENGSEESLFLVEVPVVAELTPIMSAVRLANGLLHVALFDRGSSAVTDGADRGLLHHVWWRPGVEAQIETLPAGFWFDEPRLRTDGQTVMTHSTSFTTSRIYSAATGPFAQDLFPAMRVLDVALHAGCW